MSRIDRAFRRFQRQGDPDALAFVFDRAAPELARLAAHLAPHAAEDVVQETFVFAIERVGDFRQNERVLPWLVGILAHKARAARRRDRRSPDAGRLPEPDVPLPLEDVARAELRDVLGAAIAAMPARYREVLEPQLREGLTPDAIAQRLGRSASTVRTQLSRGLDRLRRLLPPSLASVAAVPPLHRVRAHVLATAHVRVTPVVASGGTAWLVAGVAAVVVVSGAWFATRVAPTPELLPTAALDGTVQAPSPSEVDAPSSPATREAVSRANPAVPVTELVAVAGRLVAAETGAPLPGPTVTARHDTNSYAQSIRFPATHVTDPPPITTAMDGSFRLELAAALAVEWGITFEAAGREGKRVVVAGRELWNDLGGTFDLGEIALRTGVPLGGRVLDEQGTPVAGMRGTLWVPRSGRVDNHGLHFISDAEGRWRGEHLLPPGRYRAGKQLFGADGFTFDSSHRIVRAPQELIAQPPEALLDVIVRVPVTVRGRVVDEEGAPLRPACVVAVPPSADVAASAPIRRDGTFELFGFATLGSPVHVAVRDERHPAPAASLVPRQVGGLLAAPVATTWGSSDVVLRVPRPAPLAPVGGVVELTVVDASSGLPIEQYGLHLSQSHGNGDSRSQSGPSGHHPGSRARVDTLPAGRWTFEIRPPIDYAPADVEIDVPATGTLERRVELVRLALCALVVEVRGVDGRPLAGAEVEAISSEEGHELTSQSAVMPALGSGFPRHHQQLDASRTGSMGRCRLLVPQQARPYGLRVRADSVPTILVREVVCDGPRRDLVVSATTGARLVARLVPASVAMMSVRLRLLDDARNSLHLAHLGDRGNGFAFDHEGALAIDGLPTGTFVAQLVYEPSFGPFAPPHVLRELGQLVLDPRNPTELTIDAAALRPAAVRGRVQLAGGAAWNSHVPLMLGQPLRMGLTSSPTVGWFQADADGRFTVAVMPPGRYHVRANIGGVEHTSAEEIVLEPGTSLDFVFTLLRDS